MRLDAYIRVSRVNARSGDSFISPDLQRERISIDPELLRGIQEPPEEALCLDLLAIRHRRHQVDSSVRAVVVLITDRTFGAFQMPPRFAGMASEFSQLAIARKLRPVPRMSII